MFLWSAFDHHIPNILTCIMVTGGSKVGVNRIRTSCTTQTSHHKQLKHLLFRWVWTLSLIVTTVLHLINVTLWPFDHYLLNTLDKYMFAFQTRFQIRSLTLPVCVLDLKCVHINMFVKSSHLLGQGCLL